jgi:antitoxin (DNA-binding transcriptional repressor) of toxin-antitoxin stability system
METYVSVFEAKSQLSKLIEQLDDGNEVVITKHGVPVARLIKERPKKIKLGLLEGQFPELDQIDFDSIPTDPAWFKTDPELQRLIDEYYRDEQ